MSGTNGATAIEKFETPTLQEIQKKLDAKIPRDAIAEREGGGGRRLSYLEGWYVINRLNEIFGQGNWSTGQYTEKLYEQENDGRHEVAYTAMVSLTVNFPNGRQAKFEDVGYGDGKDRHRGKAHESAVKEAVTDGIKRCAKNLGMSMGLALYDKSQENVDDGEPEAPAPKPVAKRSGKTEANNAAPVAPKAANVAEAAPTGRAEINEMITKMSKVIIAKRTKTVEQLRAEMKSQFGAEKKEDLTDEQATIFYQYLKGVLG